MSDDSEPLDSDWFVMSASTTSCSSAMASGAQSISAQTVVRRQECSLVEPADLIAGPVGHQRGEVQQSGSELVLVPFVLLRPDVSIVDDEFVGACLAELVGKSGVEAGCLGESLPGVGPLALSSCQLAAGGDVAVDGRIESQIGHAQLHECFELRLAHAISRTIGILDPSQQGADEVGVDQGKEVVGVEVLAGHSLVRLVQEDGRRELERLVGRLVAGDVEAETVLLIAEERPGDQSLAFGCANHLLRYCSSATGAISSGQWSMARISLRAWPGR